MYIGGDDDKGKWQQSDWVAAAASGRDSCGSAQVAERVCAPVVITTTQQLGIGSRSGGRDSGFGGARLQWFERAVGAGGICGRSDKLDDNIGKPHHARELLCDAFCIANCADSLFATRAARASRASSRAAAGARERLGSGRLAVLPRVLVLVGLWLISNRATRGD